MNYSQFEFELARFIFAKFIASEPPRDTSRTFEAIEEFLINTRDEEIEQLFEKVSKRKYEE